MNSPVALFVYNRPDHTRRTVEALARNSIAGDTEIWVFCDGSKTNEACDRIQSVRAEVHRVADRGLFAGVRIVEAETNLGLAASVIQGVSRVIDARGRVIVLEDDLVTAPDFLDFMNAALDFYQYEKSVGSVTAYSPLGRLPSGYRRDVYVLPRNSSWGWGTWRSRWDKVDWALPDLSGDLGKRQVRRAFNQCGSDRYDRLVRQVEFDIDSWSIRFGFWQFRNGMLTVFPAVSRVKSTGWDGSGVHLSAGNSALNNEIQTRAVKFDLSMPEPDPRIFKAFKKAYSGRFRSRAARWLRSNGLFGLESALRPVLGATRRRKASD